MQSGFHQYTSSTISIRYFLIYLTSIQLEAIINYYNTAYLKIRIIISSKQPHPAFGGVGLPYLNVNSYLNIKFKAI